MPGSILIVEDDAMIRDLADRILTGAGYSVAPVASGTAALDLLKRVRFDLVLLDIHMPNMSGLDLLDHMRRLYVKVPVVMMTADREMSTVAAARERGCIGYVVKPFLPETLVERVRKALVRT
ncbi:MAG: response regulator [Brevundimonas sp.]|uniref:response regulator n=1 Tax=Brevundimonas sp. TaxID=1871086 RepID=UPI001A356D7D|nr:response regulator [Brevundimonas sp.]MBJ7448550.1 response regulator [Brevundimonas sp.]